jgi:hypothetical protein
MASIKGTVVRVRERVIKSKTDESKSWNTLDVVIETVRNVGDQTYNDEVCVNFFGKTKSDFSGLEVGKEVEIAYSLKSFHSTKNDTYYNNINGYRIDILSGTAQAPKQETKPDPIELADFSSDLPSGATDDDNPLPF